MSKEPERKTNRHSPTRDHPKQGIGVRISKQREKRSFQQSASNKVVWAPFIKKKDKRGLNTADHVQYCTVKYYSNVCTVNISNRISANGRYIGQPQQLTD